MEYANDDTTDIPGIDLNICVAVQPYQFKPLDRDSGSVSGTGSDSASAESDEECRIVADQVLKVVSKSSFDVNTH